MKARIDRRWFLKGAASGPLLAGAARAQPGTWPAKWISVPGAPRAGYGVYHFRRGFTLARRPASFRVDVSADQRYRLFVNGTGVSRGPARGDLLHWRYETVDLAPHLRAGKNVLAAVVWNHAEHAPMAQLGAQTAFMVHGAGDAERVVDTGPEWRCTTNAAFRPVLPNEFPGPVGPGDAIDGKTYPWGWERADFDDGGWQAAEAIGAATPASAPNNRTPWFLVPRPIPLMEERPQRLATVREASGVSAPPGFPARPVPLTVPPRTRARLLLDQGHLTTAYPEIVVSGGAGATVSLGYAENLWEAGTQWGKGHRDQVAGKVFRGGRDRFVPDGGAQRAFAPLWWRTYRYVELTVETAEAPLRIDDLRATYTGYPFTQAPRWRSPDAELQKIVDVGWHTARLCAHETYVDCPFYEQLQYVGDTRVQALISIYTTGDDRLMRNAIEAFADSRAGGGATTSRYPAMQPQYIPPFSLWWIGMVHDHHVYRDDPAFVRRHLPGVRDVLGFFVERQLPDGRLGPLPWWNFVDWTPSWRAGVPPGWNIGFTASTPKGSMPRDNTAIGLVPRSDPDGSSAPIDLQLLLALQWAADLERAVGSPAMADEWARQATRLSAAIRRAYWDPARKLFADTPKRAAFSQHASTLAVLGGVVEGAEARDLVARVVPDRSLEPASIYFRHYLNEAMNRVGLGDLFLDQLGPWRRLLALGLTTWAETEDPSRSECHAWGSSPNLEIYRTILGIDSAAPGFRKVRVRPSLGRLAEASGTCGHPRGTITVALARSGRTIRARVELPPGVDGQLELGREQRQLAPGANTLTIET